MPKSSSSLIMCGIGLAAAAGCIYYYYKYYKNKYPKNEYPKNWQHVGELTDLICYPIKSCGAVRINKINCTELGLQDGYLRDRIFLIVTLEGNFVTAREYPKLVLVKIRIEIDQMILSGPGMMEVVVDLKRLNSPKPQKCKMRGEIMYGIDCGEEVARWFSRYILSEDFGLRLMFYPYKYPLRKIVERSPSLEKLNIDDRGTYQDATSFMLFNESSLADLNMKLTNSVDILNFRPNFVVKGPQPYEEDKWKWIKIGNNAIFENIKACTRCIFTNINPETGMRSPDGNPLKTLKTYRKIPGLGNSPVLGAHFGLRRSGVVSIGDPVFVGISTPHES